LINLQVRGVATPNFIIALAFGYGGLVQLLAGMWYVTFFMAYLYPLQFFMIVGFRAFGCIPFGHLPHALPVPPPHVAHVQSDS
jgi:succinate-acetate transporter protein